MRRQNRSQSATEPVVLIAMERGSRWPSWAREAAPDAIVLAQQPGETPLAFAERGARRLARIGPAQHLVKVVLAVADDTTREALIARCLLTQASLQCMAPSVPDIVLVADKSSGSELRGGLFGLAGALRDHLGSARGVSVHFGQNPPARQPKAFFDTTAQVLSSY